MNHVDYLRSLGACYASIEFAGKYPSLASAYSACSRPDWLFWLAERTGADHKTIVLAGCACARTALPYAKGDAARIAIETAESWTRGEATIDQVRAAADAADADAQHTGGGAAAYASTAACDIADAAAASTSAAYTAYAADAVYAAAYADDVFNAVKHVCDLIRQFIPCPVPA